MKKSKKFFLLKLSLAYIRALFNPSLDFRLQKQEVPQHLGAFMKLAFIFLKFTHCNEFMLMGHIVIVILFYKIACHFI